MKAAAAPRRTGNRRGAETRERILRASFKVVADRPVSEVQIAQIAEEAGLSSTVVLYHFPSRDSLLLGTLTWSEFRIQRRRDRAVALARTSEERLASYVRVYLPASSRDVYWKLWLEYWLRSARAESIHDEVTESGALDWLAQLRSLIAEGIDAGRFRRVEPGEFVERFTALLDGLSVHVLMKRLTRKQAFSMALEHGGAWLDCDLQGASG